MFGLRGFWTPYIKGAKEAFRAIPKIQKPKFRLRNLPNYFLIEIWMIGNVFRYVDYRVRRALGIH